MLASTVVDIVKAFSVPHNILFNYNFTFSAYESLVAVLADLINAVEYELFYFVAGAIDFFAVVDSLSNVLNATNFNLCGRVISVAETFYSSLYMSEIYSHVGSYTALNISKQRSFETLDTLLNPVRLEKQQISIRLNDILDEALS